MDSLADATGHTDPPHQRLRDFNATVKAAGKPPVKACVAFKVRPLLATGTPGYMNKPEYEAVRASVVPQDAPQHPANEPRFWLVDQEASVRVVYAEHETGLEIVIAAVGVAMSVIQAAPIAVPWITRYIRRIRGEIEREDEKCKTGPRDRRVTLSIEVHADKPGRTITSVSVCGDVDDAALAGIIESGLRGTATSPAAT